MRRMVVTICSVFLLVPAGASAADFVGTPLTHGPDPASVAAGSQAPAPSGGVLGRSLAPGTHIAGRRVVNRLPTSWCGPERTTDDTASETSNGDYKYHAVYMIPSDGADRFGRMATGLQTEAMQASGLLESLYGRAIRFDMGTNCGQQYLDISVVRLPQTTAELQQLAPSSTGTLDAVSNAIDAAGFHTIRPNDTVESASTRTRNYVIWLDGPAPPGSCGQATSFDDQTRDQSNLNNLAGKVAIVFPNGNGGFCSSTTVRHEIGHTLGALQPTAPHAFDGAHCNDAYEDTMCYTNSPKVTATGIRGQFFDYKNDDYWDPPNGTPLPWWTADENRFICPDAYCNVAPGTTDITGPSTPIIPDTSATSNDGSTVFGTNGVKAAKPSVKAKVKKGRARKGRRSYTVSMRARGSGKAVVTVRCRPKANQSIRTVYRKRTKLPQSLRAKVNCASAPRAAILAD
jgi:hypothetical protein